MGGFTRQRTVHVFVSVIRQGMRDVSGGNGADSRSSLKRKTVLDKQVSNSDGYARGSWCQEAGTINQR